MTRVIAYAETSAVLAWLLHEESAAPVRRTLSRAERVVSSTLTGVECARALMCGIATGRLEQIHHLAALKLLDTAFASWVTLEMTGRILDRARARFPEEPVRALDALHLATALMFHEAHGSLTMVSLDDRIRANAAALGLAVAP